MKVSKKSWHYRYLIWLTLDEYDIRNHSAPYYIAQLIFYIIALPFLLIILPFFYLYEKLTNLNDIELVD